MQACCPEIKEFCGVDCPAAFRLTAEARLHVLGNTLQHGAKVLLRRRVQLFPVDENKVCQVSRGKAKSKLFFPKMRIFVRLSLI